jgi:hypothetical protein
MRALVVVIGEFFIFVKLFTKIVMLQKHVNRKNLWLLGLWFVKCIASKSANQIRHLAKNHFQMLVVL